MAGLGVDLHPYYQRGTNALPGVEYGWIKMADDAQPYAKRADGRVWAADAHAALFKRLGIPFGGYEFAGLGSSGAAAFDALWAECVRLGATGVTPAVDIEGPGWTPASATQRGRTFCQRARARGVRPAVYMDLSLLQACRPDLWPEQPVIWAPRYGALPQAGGRYTGRYDVHQFTSSGSLPGSAGTVDFNQAYSTAHLLANSSHQEDELTDEERTMLRRVYGQLTGTEDVKAPVTSWGFSSKEYPTSKATPVDFIRAMDQNIIHLARAVEKLTAEVEALKGATP